MTPQIGFGTGSQHDSTPSIPLNAGLIEMPAASLAGAPGATLATHSPIADYAYRIAALTAGIALLATFL